MGGVVNGIQDEEHKGASQVGNGRIHNRSDTTTTTLKGGLCPVGDYDAISTTEIEEAKIVADAQLDLAFSTLDMMKRRKLSADPDAYKELMEACGRCGNTQRATQLIVLLRQDGLLVDSKMYSTYLRAYSVSKIINRNEPIDSPLAHIPLTTMHHSLNRASRYNRNNAKNAFYNAPFSWKAEQSSRSAKAFMKRSSSKSSLASDSLDHDSEMGSSITSSRADSITETSSQSSFRRDGRWNPSNWFVENRRRALALSITSKRRNKIKLQRKEKLITTDQVAKHLAIGDNLLNFLYAELVIDTNSDACPKCSRC